MRRETTIEKNALAIIKAGAVEIRKIPLRVTNEEVKKLSLENQPFLYSSGNWGPGYLMIKGLVGRKRILKPLVRQLALLVAERIPNLDFIAGNVTGGMMPGWILSEELEPILGREIPFVYIRPSRKSGGQKELVTGLKGNPDIPPTPQGLVIEELVNFAETTCNGIEALRDDKVPAIYAATILFYNNPRAIETLKDNRVEMIYLLTLPELLEVAERHQTHSQEAIADYREFLKDPLKWQAKRGLKPIEKGGTI